MTLDNATPHEESTEATISPPLPAKIYPPLSTKTVDEIEAALSLDLLLYPRPSRFDHSHNITLKKIKHHHKLRNY